jgi:LacI family transcriptional regulator
MQDIADSLKISKNSVSLAISGKPGVSDALREQVLAIGSRLGYFDNKQKRVRKNNLLLIVDDRNEHESDFFMRTISATLRYAKSIGFNMLMTSISRDYQEHLVIPKIYYDMEAEGVLFTGNIKKEFVQIFIDAGIPNVLMVQYANGLFTDNVVSANEDGGYLLTKYLLSLGHRKIGYFADISTFETYNRRLYGYRKALEEANIRSGAFEYLFSIAPIQLPEKILEPHFEYILGMREGPTAWFCGNDHLAILLINWLRKRGISVPKDLSVVGFDARPAAAIFHPILTTYDSRIDLIAKYTVDLIASHIGNGGENWHPVIISAIGRLVQGESTRQL